MSDVFAHPTVLALVRLALEEDVGRGDATSEATIESGTRAAADVVAREAVVAAGLPLAAVVLREAGAAAVEVAVLAAEGERVAAGGRLLALRGDARAILAAERVLLNFLQRLCGVATLTRRFADAVAGTKARVVDTRKTIPGWRLLDKYAVRTGGGANHRFGLDDGILVKDNHVAACGGVRAAIERARAHAHHLLRVECECDDLTQVDEALAAGAEAILLDNMTTGEMASAVAAIGGRALVEASGGMTLDRVREVAETGVDLISVGALTHSARAVDLSMELRAEPAGGR